MPVVGWYKRHRVAQQPEGLSGAETTEHTSDP
jgi:hypothetical protein